MMASNMDDLAHAAANAEQLRLLQEEMKRLTAADAGTRAVHLADLTNGLARVYCADISRGFSREEKAEQLRKASMRDTTVSALVTPSLKETL